MRALCFVLLFLLLELISCSYPRYYLPNNRKVCSGRDVTKKKPTGCVEVRGDIRINGDLTEDQQERFHSIRLLRGRVSIKNTTIKHLTAFKNVRDIEIDDQKFIPVKTRKQYRTSNPGFQVMENPFLESIDLSSLLSFTSTYDTGLSIKRNGKYKMNYTQWEELFEKTGNRRHYEDIEKWEKVVEHKNIHEAVGISITVGFVISVFFLMGIISLVYFGKVQREYTDQVMFHSVAEDLNQVPDQNTDIKMYDQLTKRMPNVRKKETKSMASDQLNTGPENTSSLQKNPFSS